MQRLFIVIAVFFSAGLLFIVSCSKTPTQVTPGKIPESAPAKSEAKADWSEQSIGLRKAEEVEWQKALTEARKEGRVVVYGPPGVGVRQGFTDSFHRAYPGIELEFTGGPGPTHVPRILAARRGGVYLVDLFIAGTSTLLQPSIKPLAQPVPPLLILPEVKDPKSWMGGKLDYADDEGKLNLVNAAQVKSALIYNPSLIETRVIENMSYWDLVKPEFKQKIALMDPTITGPGNAGVFFMYINPKLGPDYVKALVQNEPVISRDQRQMGEWVGRGKYPVQLGTDETTAQDMISAGMPLKILGQLKEGTYLTAAYGSLIYMDKAPHPNAAKVFLNWFLSREGQSVWMQTTSIPSRRLDISVPSNIPSFSVAKPDVEYLATYGEKAVKQKETFDPLIREMFGK